MAFYPAGVNNYMYHGFSSNHHLPVFLPIRDKSSRSHHIDKKRGPGRPSKRKFSKDNGGNSVKEEDQEKKEDSQESSSPVQLGTAVLLEAAASLEEPPPKKKKKEGKEKKKKGSKESGEKVIV